MRKRYDILHRIFEENKCKSKKFVEIQFIVVRNAKIHKDKNTNLNFACTIVWLIACLARMRKN